MKLVSLHSLLILLFLVFSFSSCGNNNSTEDNNDNQESSDNFVSEEMSSSNSASASSKLTKFEEKPCNLLTEAIIRKYVTTDKKIESSSTEYQSRYLPAKCFYTWEKMSEEEQNEKLMEMMMKGGQGGVGNMATTLMDYHINISITSYAGRGEDFIPNNNLTDAEIEARAKEVGEETMENKMFKDMDATSKKESAELAANMTRDKLTSLRDETVVIEGVGDAAYSVPMSKLTNTLMVLSDGKAVTIEIYVSDDRKENIEIAKKIAKEIL